MADIKDPETKKSEEKATDSDKKAKRFALGLLTLLVLALIFSMRETSNSHKPTPSAADNAEQQAIPITDFNQQMQFEQSQLNAARMRNQNAPGYNTLLSSDDDAKWEAKERTRVLDSRRAGFGLEDQVKNAQNGSTGGYPPSPVAYPPGYPPATRSNEPGANIIGRGVDDSYPGQQQGDALLIPTGTIIDGVLDRDLISDYTGPWEGHLTQDVYSIDNQFILLPKGTKIMGQSLHVPNVNEPIQNRMGLTVEWAVLPNGKRIDFRKHTPIDQSGVPAFAGDVNRHFLAQFLAVAAYATISAAGPQDEVSQYGYVQPTFKGQFAEGYREALLPFVMKYLSLVPTVTLHAGMPIKIHTQDDMYVKPWARVNTTVYSSSDL